VSVDPLAAKYPHYTPYQYAGNKPINFVDLDGLEEGSRELTKPIPTGPKSEQQVQDIDNQILQNEKDIAVASGSVQFWQHQIDNLTEFVEGFRSMQYVVEGLLRSLGGAVVSGWMESHIQDALADLNMYHDHLALAEGDVAF